MNIEERSIESLHADLSAQRTEVQRLVAQYLKRIEALDSDGPALHSVIEVNPDALQIAQELDHECRAGRMRGPLHGLGILIKDNIATHDRMPTTAGSLALLGSAAVKDAFVVQRLRAAGAVILGKANMSEWSNGRSLQSRSGWSARGGLTRNPHVLDRSASGSSSGCAAAVAASLCAAAVGTETDGSILGPAAVCGIVGFKPTVGRVSRFGVIPLSHSMDTPGPMARSVRDCALLLGAMVGRDDRDSATWRCPDQNPTEFVSALGQPVLRGARLGVMREPHAALPGVDTLFEGVLATLSRAGAVLVDPITIAYPPALASAKRTVLLHEMKAGVNAYLREFAPGANVRNLADIIAFNEAHATLEMPCFGQDIFHLAEAKASLSSSEYLDALDTMQGMVRSAGIEAVLKQFELDALVAPSGGPAWPSDLPAGAPAMRGSSTPAAMAGTPGITVPAGAWRGLPLGVSFFGAAWSEKKLLALAYEFEQLGGARSSPAFVASLD